MARMDIDNPYGFTDKLVGRGYTTTHPSVEAANYDSVSDLRTRLTAINATSFTTARLDAMTKNDMMYALRVHSADSVGI